MGSDNGLSNLTCNWGKHVVDMSTLLSSFGIMTIIILLGFIIARKYKVTAESKQLLIIIIIHIAVPSIILNGIFNTDMNGTTLAKMFMIFLLSIMFNTVGILLGWFSAVIFRFRAIKAKKIAILSGLGNTGFIGIPLCERLFGPEGGLLAAIYDAGLDVVAFTLVIVLLQKNEKFSFRSFKAIMNMPIAAIMIGVSIAIIGYQPPLLIKHLTSTLANLAAPLAMIYIGLLIPEFLKEKKKIPVRFVSLSLIMKLFIIPLLFIMILQIMPIAVEVKNVVSIQVSMPTFMLATVLFAKYANDEETAVMITIYSTILSLITVPLIVYATSLFL